MRMAIAVFNFKVVCVMAKSLSKKYLNKYKKYQNIPTQKQKKLNVYERYQLALTTANLNANKNGIWRSLDRKRVQTWRAKLYAKLDIQE